MNFVQTFCYNILSHDFFTYIAVHINLEALKQITIYSTHLPQDSSEVLRHHYLNRSILPSYNHPMSNLRSLGPRVPIPTGEINLSLLQNVRTPPPPPITQPPYHWVSKALSLLLKRPEREGAWRWRNLVWLRSCEWVEPNLCCPYTPSCREQWRPYLSSSLYSVTVLLTGCINCWVTTAGTAVPPYCCEFFIAMLLVNGGHRKCVNL